MKIFDLRSMSTRELWRTNYIAMKVKNGPMVGATAAELMHRTRQRDW